MVSWILIVVLLIVVVLIWIKFKEFGHKSKFKVLLILLGIFLLTLGFVWFKARPDLTTYQGFLGLGKSYFAWVGGLFKNMGHITGYAVQQDWGVNSSISPYSP
jgi:Trk-type K+ transport system membrane component